jgi:hypothetical protein
MLLYLDTRSNSVHLSSALKLKEEVSAEVLFSCSDRVLMEAARQEGLHLPS